MKRLILIFAMLAALLFVGCNKAEKNFVGHWGYSDGRQGIDYVSTSVTIDKRGSCSAVLSVSTSKLTSRRCYSGTWLEVNDNTIHCYVSDETGVAYTWTFTGYGDNEIFWIDNSLILFKL